MNSSPRLNVCPYIKRAPFAALAALIGLVSNAGAANALVNTATEKSTGFTNGTFSPLYTCTTLAGNAGVAATLDGQPCVKFEWYEANYNGTRLGRGTEACSSLEIQKEGWFGFYIYLPSPGYPTNKQAGIAQFFANNSACNSWAGMLDLVNNDLVVSHRGNCGTPTTATVFANFPRNRWVSVITHVVASHLNAGKFEIFIDGVSRYNATGINFGYDTWTASDALQSPNHIGLKIGQYNFDDANYTNNEVRTSYYTNLTQISGNPAGVFNYIRNPMPVSSPVTYAAESAVAGGGTVVEATNANYRGTGYMNLPLTGGTLTFNNVNAGAGGPKTLDIRNALGVAGRTGQLVVNGVTTSITFATTSNWSTWVTKSVAVTLNAGTANTVQLRSNGQDLANIDEITLR